LDAEFMLLKLNAARFDGACEAAHGSQKALQSLWHPPASESNCMVAATMLLELHEPSQRELVKQSRAGMGNSGLMTVKSRESCK